MLEKYLKKLKKYNIELISSEKKWDIFLNTAIFTEGIPKNLEKYKEKFLWELGEKQKHIEKIKKQIENDEFLIESIKKLLLNEVDYKIMKIKFLKETFDIEAHKLDPNHKIENKKTNYEYYNKYFFWVSKKNLNRKFVIYENSKTDIYFTKKELLELIEYSKSLNPDIKFRFWNYPHLSYLNWYLQIPDFKRYNLRTIIVLFFHETTHFFRNYNEKRNLGFSYDFSDYMDLEEGIAWYNEYFYANQIINYWKYNPYYNRCYQILLEDISEDEKKEKIYEVLKNKSFTYKKSLNFYQRFHRFVLPWTKNLFLKDLVYLNGYKIVSKLIKQDSINYEKIMKWKIGLKNINSDIITTKNNYNTKWYFWKMRDKIKSYI